MDDTDRLVQRLFIEGAETCGDDPIAVGHYVQERIKTMSPDDQQRFKGVAERVSAYRDDSKPSGDHH